MGRKPNDLAGFDVQPVGPCNVIRVIAIERSSEAPCEVTAVARVDIILDDLGCHFGGVACFRFGRRAGGYLGEPPACRPVDLMGAVWEPAAPDVLVAHDITMQRLIIPSAITGLLPWIGTLRIARLAWGNDLPHTPGEILAAKGFDDPGMAESEPVVRPAVREALQVASLVDSMLASMDVRRWAADHPSAAHALRPALGEMAADFALQSMLDMSAAGRSPPSEWPAPWDDDDVWRSVPLDDLLPFAGSDEDRSGGLALTEVRRRTAGLGSPEQVIRAPVLLRRLRFDIPEEGRCDGW